MDNAKQLIFLFLYPSIQLISLTDVEIVLRIGGQIVIAGMAILTYLHKTKTKNKNDE